MMHHHLVISTVVIRVIFKNDNDLASRVEYCNGDYAFCVLLIMM